jgi:hypothetical protein
MVETVKTTISFPENILKALREYMISRGDTSLHDQSNIVAAALYEYLTKRGMNIDQTNKKWKRFLVEEADDNSA